MNELSTISLINKHNSTRLRLVKDKHCSYDAEDDLHIVEIKNRRSYYPTKMIEAMKLFANYQKAQLKNKFFIYVVTDEKGLYTFNISKHIDTIIASGLVKKEQPSKTDFKGSKTIIKYYYNLDEELSSFTYPQ
ncbi:MAG: hypothetical protein CMC15_14370 [Flavobacteriaceae bacterium]|nr:hypothetical protein [Flavobacteriaceae bacterium]